MPRLVVFVQRVDVVFSALAIAFGGRARIGRDEVDLCAVRRPGGRRNAGGVPGQHARFAAFGRKQLDLAVANEEERRAVGRPTSGTGRVAGWAEGELHRRAAAGVLTPEMPEQAAGVPVGVGERVDDEPAVGRQLRVDDARQFGDVEQRHRLTRRGWRLTRLVGRARRGSRLWRGGFCDAACGRADPGGCTDTERGERHMARPGNRDETGRSSE